MARHWWRRTALCVAAFLGLLTCGARGIAQSVALESSALGATGSFSGSSVATSQFVGWRFEIGAPLAVERVGGHLLGFEEGGIFAALVALESIDSVPLGAPFTEEEVIATTVFQPPLPSEEVLVPLSVTLDPGSYALVFGTGLFGASGAGALPNFDDQPDIAPTDISSFIFWSIPFFGEPFEWRLNLASHMRFVIEGQMLQVPGDYNLDGDVTEADYQTWRSDFGSVAVLAGADGNHDRLVDAADYTIWRDYLEAVDSGAGARVGVPEPATVILIVMSALMVIVRPLRRAGRRT